MFGLESIIVCGGGIAGVSFAASLLQCCKQEKIKPPHITILEKSPSNESKLRSREYTVSLRDTDTLSFLGVRDKAEGLLSPSKEFYVAVYDRNDNHSKYISVPSNKPGDDTIRLKMQYLYTLLYELLPPDVVFKWNSDVTQVKPAGNKVNITLSDGAVLSADFVVVADGNRSALRSQLFPEEKLNFAGVVGVAGLARVSTIPKEVKQSHGMTLARNNLLWMSHEDQDMALWAVMYKSDKPLSGTIINRIATSEETKASQKQLEEHKAMVSSRFYSEYPVLRELVPASPVSSIRVINGYDKMPHESGKKYERIVLIGDANHPVTPLSGIGASMALTDAKKLAIALTSTQHKTLSSAIHAFELDMIKRAGSVVKEGRFSIKLFMSSNPLLVYTKYTLFFCFGFIARHISKIKWSFVGAVVVLVILVFYQFVLH